MTDDLSKAKADALRIPDEPAQPGTEPQVIGDPFSGGIPFDLGISPDAFDNFTPEEIEEVQADVYESLAQPLVGRYPRQGSLVSRSLVAQVTSEVNLISIARPAVLQIIALPGTVPATAVSCQMYAQPGRTTVYGTSGIYDGINANNFRLFLPSPGDWIIQLKLQDSASAVVAGTMVAIQYDATNVAQANKYVGEPQGSQYANPVNLSIPAVTASDFFNLANRIPLIACEIRNIGTNPSPFVYSWGDTASLGVGTELDPGERVLFEGRSLPMERLSVFNTDPGAQTIQGFLYLEQR